MQCNLVLAIEDVFLTIYLKEISWKEKLSVQEFFALVREEELRCSEQLRRHRDVVPAAKENL